MCQRIYVYMEFFIKFIDIPKLDVYLQLEITLKECRSISISRYNLSVLVMVEVCQSKGTI